MSFAAAGVAPFRGMLCNLATGEAMSFPQNPTELGESMGPEWAKVKIPGLSHRRLNFDSTDNTTFTVDFYLDRAKAQEAHGDNADILDFKRFLQALALPVEGAEDVVGGSPPPVLFIWPSLVSVRCRLARLELRYTEFDFFAAPKFYTARTTFIEDPEQRITSEQIRQVGSLRGGV